MKAFILSILLLAGCYCLFQYTQQPVRYQPVTVYVKQGDTLHDIIRELKYQYQDERDWREIYCEAKQDNAFSRYIVPGQKLVFRMICHEQ